MPLRVATDFALGVGPYFGLAAANFQCFDVGEDAVFSATRLVWRRGGAQPLTVTLPAAQSYFVMVYLSGAKHCDLLVNGTETPLRYYPSGSICLVDLEKGAAIRLHSDLDALAFCIPHVFFSGNGFFDELAFGLPLRCVRGQADPLISHIAAALTPTLDSGAAFSASVMRPIAVAIGAHLLQRYGEGFMGGHALLDDAARKGVIAAPQGRRTTGFDASPGARSQGHTPPAMDFCIPPDWHLDRQIAFAKQCLFNPETDMAAVAGLCGFPDMAMFEEFFRSHTGVSPHQWRLRAFN